jgi:putative hemolysin
MSMIARRPFTSRPVSAALLVVLCALLAGCASMATDPMAPAPAQRVNPASQLCVEKGGKVYIFKTGSGGEYGVCRFAGNRQCEEWAMLRGECPEGGIRIATDATPAARFCAITGGTYAVTAQRNTPGEQGTCRFPSGAECDARAYYDGRCSR